MAHPLLERAFECVRLAKQLRDQYPAQGAVIPPDVAKRIDSLVSEAEDCRERYNAEPVRKHDPRAGGVPPGGIDPTDYRTAAAAPAATDGVKLLAPGQRVADLYPDSSGRAVGALGCLAKSLAGDVDERELRHFLGTAQYKDMLSSGSAGVLVPEPIAATVIDRLRARTVVISLGARTVPMGSATLTLPRVTTDPSASWLAEGATITPSDGALDSVVATARRLTSITKFSDELSEDSDPELAGDVLANALARSFAVELDRVALRGSGTPPEPDGVRNQGGIAIVDLGVNGADATWDTLSTLRQTVESANAQPSGFVLAPRTFNALPTSKGSDSHYLAIPANVAELRRVATSNIPINLVKGTSADTTEIYCGDWRELLIPMRVRFELRRLFERYAEEGKVALRARIRADVQLAHPASFAVAIGATN